MLTDSLVNKLFDIKRSPDKNPLRNPAARGG